MTELADSHILIGGTLNLLSAIPEKLVMTELTDMSHACGSEQNWGTKENPHSNSFIHLFIHSTFKYLAHVLKKANTTAGSSNR